jgi:hypothetical protein
VILEFGACLWLVFSDCNSFSFFLQGFAHTHCHKDIILDLHLSACLMKGFWFVLSFGFILFVRLFLIKKHFLLAYVKIFSCRFRIVYIVNWIWESY